MAITENVTCGGLRRLSVSLRDNCILMISS